jgi:hypothetical protein
VTPISVSTEPGAAHLKQSNNPVGYLIKRLQDSIGEALFG